MSPPSPHTMLECMSNIWQSDEILLCFDLMIQAIKTSTNKKHHLSVFLLSPTLYGGKGKQKLLILPQGMRKRRVNALIRSVTMKACHLYLIHRRWTYNKKQQNFILYKNSPSAFRIFDFFIFYFFEFKKIHENFMNFHKLSWALPRPKNVCSNSLRWWCFLVKSSYPCTRICQEIRWFQQAFEMPKFENFENFKRSFQIMKKKLSKSRFFRIIAFFRSPKCITIEDI